MVRFLLILSLFIVSAVQTAGAQGLTQSNSKEPIEITADKTLEWKRNEKLFVATQNALAKQGDVSIAAAVLTANYRDGQESSMEIYKMKATDNVVIHTRESSAYGDVATYNVDDALAIMTGDNLKLVSPDQILTARDQFEYHVNKGELIAIGDAKIDRPKPEGGKDTVTADIISALFINNEKGERVMKQMEAKGNVVITTPTEVITGAYGIYRAKSNKADLTGGVTIRRGPNILEGDHAEVDLNTNTSKLFGGKNTSDGRVHGIFYPGSEDKSE